MITPRLPLAPLFSLADADAAYEAWGANCGPTALAAIVHARLDEVRPHLHGFDAKGYMNPTMMFDALRSSGASWRRIPVEQWPVYGLVRVQWEGPWTAPGVPMRARYRYTHWIGAATRPRGQGVFDVNCLENGAGWVARDEWERVIVPALTASYKRASGKYHVTHAIEVGET